MFAVTNFWESKSAAVEIQQGKNVADACKKVGVQHLIWSSLLNVTKRSLSMFPTNWRICLHFLVSGGKLSQVHHFDSKAEVEQYIRDIGVPASFFLPGFFMSNFPGKMLRPNPNNGAFTLALPMPTSSPIPLLDTESDTGKFVKGILLNREKTLGKQILGATDYYTPNQIVEIFKDSKPVDSVGAAAVEISGDMFKGFLAKTGAPAAIQEEMLQNMQLMPQFGYYGGASLAESHLVRLPVSQKP